MKKFEKVYVGKGHMPKEDLDIIRITIDLDEIKELAYEFEGKTMVTLEVARMKEPDTFGRTHTAYLKRSTLFRCKVQIENQPSKPAVDC